MTARTYKTGDRIVWNGEPGTFLRLAPGEFFKGREVAWMKMDSDAHNTIEQEDELEFLEPLILLTLEDCTDTTLKYASPFGYVIAADGTVYSLREPHYHGVICAMLFPDVAKEKGWAPPARGAANVFHYQRFELDNQRELPVIRISFGMGSAFNISKSDAPATAEQIDGLRRVFKKHGMKLTDEVCTHFADMTVRKCLQLMEKAG